MDVNNAIHNKNVYLVKMDFIWMKVTNVNPVIALSVLLVKIPLIIVF